MRLTSNHYSTYGLTLGGLSYTLSGLEEVSGQVKINEIFQNSYETQDKDWHTYSVDEKYALIIHELQNDWIPTNARLMITIPRGLAPEQKESLGEHLEDLGYRDCQVIEEPVAVAMYHVLKHKLKGKKNLLIIDFGEREVRFDLMKLQLNELGHMEWDLMVSKTLIDLGLQSIEKVICSYLEEGLELEIEEPENQLKLVQKVRAVRSLLDELEEVNFKPSTNQNMYRLTQKNLEEYVLTKIQEKALNDISCSLQQIIDKAYYVYRKWMLDEVILVGKGAQIPYIRQILRGELIERGISNRQIRDDFIYKDAIHKGTLLADCFKRGIGLPAVKEDTLDIKVINKLRDLMDLSVHKEMKEDTGGYRRIKYHQRIYEYIGKEYNKNLGKEMISLRCNGAMEKIDASKEKYFQELEPLSGEQTVIDFKVAILDEKRNFEDLTGHFVLNRHAQHRGLEYLEEWMMVCHDKASLLEILDTVSEVYYVIIVGEYEHYLDCKRKLEEKYNHIICIHIETEHQLEQAYEVVPIIKKEQATLIEENNILEQMLQELACGEEVSYTKQEPVSRQEVQAAYKVKFKNQYYGYFTEHYKVDVINQYTRSIEEKYIKKLSPGDQIILVNDQRAKNKDIIMYILDRVVHTVAAGKKLQRDYELFVRWKEALGDYVNNNFYNIEQLAVLLEQRGVSITSQAIAQWQPEGRTIAPQTRESLITLLEIIGDHELLKHKDIVYQSSKNIRKIHIKIKEIFETIVLEEGVGKKVYYSGIEQIASEIIHDFKNYSKILEVQEVRRSFESLERSKINKITNKK